LLKDALSGNCHTVMIAHISPADRNFVLTIDAEPDLYRLGGAGMEPGAALRCISGINFCSLQFFLSRVLEWEPHQLYNLCRNRSKMM
jgi:hypothetical protein